MRACPSLFNDIVWVMSHARQCVNVSISSWFQRDFPSLPFASTLRINVFSLYLSLSLLPCLSLSLSPSLFISLSLCLPISSYIPPVYSLSLLPRRRSQMSSRTRGGPRVGCRHTWCVLNTSNTARLVVLNVYLLLVQCGTTSITTSVAVPLCTHVEAHESAADTPGASQRR